MEMKLPQKKYYRQRAHSNPLGDHNLEYPLNPQEMNWSNIYPKMHQLEVKDKEVKRVEVLDIGCGYGGLLVALSSVLSDNLILGMEIRVKVSDYVQDRIKALQESEAPLNPVKYHNIACIRTNAMKYLPNFFHKGQIKKMFFLFPDPHFKKQKHKWRIISRNLLAEYAYIMKIGGLVYTITDVKDVYEWIVSHFQNHPLFVRVYENSLTDDACYQAIFNTTEEGKKVERNSGSKYPAVFRRIDHVS